MYNRWPIWVSELLYQTFVCKAWRSKWIEIQVRLMVIKLLVDCLSLRYFEYIHDDPHFKFCIFFFSCWITINPILALYPLSNKCDNYLNSVGKVMIMKRALYFLAGASAGKCWSESQKYLSLCSIRSHIPWLFLKYSMHALQPNQRKQSSRHWWCRCWTPSRSRSICRSQGCRS